VLFCSEQLVGSTTPKGSNIIARGKRGREAAERDPGLREDRQRKRPFRANAALTTPFALPGLREGWEFRACSGFAA